MIHDQALKEATAKFQNGEFSIRELAEAAGTSEEAARQFAEEEGFRPGSVRGLFRSKTPWTGEGASPATAPATGGEPEAAGKPKDLRQKLAKSEKNGEKEIPAELFVAAYMRGFDAGFQRGFDTGIKTVN
jgi:hypothetical protein